MIAIQQLSHGAKAIPLGQAAQIQLRWEAPEPPPVQVRVYVRSNGVLHLTPLAEWSAWEGAANAPFWFFPESPGEHVLRVHWSTGPATGSAERSLNVVGPSTVTGGPERAKVDGNTTLWAPSLWEARALQHHERELLDALPGYVKKGSVVYDVGANIGLYSIACGRLTGSAGRVYCFEANPLCLYFLRANLAMNEVTWSEVLPVAVSDRSASLEFTVNYDNLNLGIGGDSPLFAQKVGHRIGLAARDLDGVVADFSLRPPSLVKIDIEGAEGAAVRGMERTLREHRPVLVLELHGKGAAAATVEQLDELGYSYRSLDLGRRFSRGAELVAQMPDAPIQVVALP